MIVGDILLFGINVTDATGAPANAAAMSLTVTCEADEDAGAIYSPVVASPTGTYEKNHEATVAGRYVGLWQGTGTNQVAKVQVFDVQPATDPGLISLEDAKRHLNIPLDKTTDDDELQAMIGAATSMIEAEVRGPVLPRAFLERHAGNVRTLILRQAPVIDITSAEPIDGGTGLTAPQLADLHVSDWGQVGYADGLTWLPTGTHEWTYRAGYLVTPPAIQLAAKTIVKHLWRSQLGASTLPIQGGYGGYEGGTMVATLAYGMPAGAADMLAGYRMGPRVT